MNLNYLNLLPDEMLLKLLLETDDLKTLFKWCQTSKRVNQICRDEGFWHNKYRKDYGESALEKGETWREEYKQITLGRMNSPISAGDNHYGIIDQKGNLYMVGNNEKGQLGVGKDVKKSKIPILVKFPGNTQKVIGISTGFNVSGAVTKDGKVYIWGYNDIRSSPSNQKIIWLPKELALSKKAVNIVVDVAGYIIMLEDSSIYFYLNREGLSPIKGHIKLNVIDISLNDIGIFSVVTKDHKLYMWGNLAEYLTNGGDNVKIPIHIPLPWLIRKITQKYDYPMVLTTTGNVYSLGFDLPGNTWGGIDEPILIKLPEKIVQIDAYGETFSALSETGKLYMWGDNSRGKISDEQMGDFSVPAEISLDASVNFVSIGAIFTIAVSSDGVVNYWGIPDWGPE